MILTIITLILLILTIVFKILYYKSIIFDDTWIFGAFLLFAPFAVLSIFLVPLGYVDTPNIEKKQDIETLLTYNLNEHTISVAKKFNRSIDDFNNYWFRFSIEDRSEYYVDIDSFINKEVEE